MSLVTVHGPNTMYTGTPGTPGGAGIPKASSPAGATATQRTTNGLVFDFNFPNPGTNPASDFNWTFTGPGNPVAQTARFSGTVTFTGPGAGTIVCTVAGATPPPANQAYTVSVTAVGGVPLMVQPQSEQQSADPETGVEVGYDPAAHTVDEVVEFAEAHPDQVPDILAAERAGKDRSTLLSHLEHIQTPQTH